MSPAKHVGSVWLTPLRKVSGPTNPRGSIPRTRCLPRRRNLSHRVGHHRVAPPWQLRRQYFLRSMHRGYAHHRLHQQLARHAYDMLETVEGRTSCYGDLRPTKQSVWRDHPGVGGKRHAIYSVPWSICIALVRRIGKLVTSTISFNHDVSPCSTPSSSSSNPRSQESPPLHLSSSCWYVAYPSTRVLFLNQRQPQQLSLGYEQPADTPNSTSRRPGLPAVAPTRPIPIPRQRRDSLSIAVSSSPNSLALPGGDQGRGEKHKVAQLTREHGPWYTVGGTDVEVQRLGAGADGVDPGRETRRKSSEV